MAACDHKCTEIALLHRAPVNKWGRDEADVRYVTAAGKQPLDGSRRQRGRRVAVIAPDDYAALVVRALEDSSECLPDQPCAVCGQDHILAQRAPTDVVLFEQLRLNFRHGMSSGSHLIRKGDYSESRFVSA